MSATWNRVEGLIAEGQTAWIQELRKELLLQVCERYGLAVSETNTVEEIRTVLRAYIKKNRREGPTPSPKPKVGTSFFPDTPSVAPRETIATPPPSAPTAADNRPLGHQLAYRMVDYLTLKEARQMINVFDGSEPRRVHDLLQTVEYALRKVNPEQKPDVLELVLQTRIQGEAAVELRYKEIKSFEELRRELLALYGVQLSTPALLGELFSSKQRDKESVHEYGKRITNLMMELIRACGSRTQVAAERKGVEDLLRFQALTIFQSGLNDNLKTIVKSYQYTELSASIRGAEEEEKLMNGQVTAGRRVNYSSDRSTAPMRCLRCNRMGHMARDCALTREKQPLPSTTCNKSIGRMEIVCNFCKRTGHLYRDCRDRMRRDERRAGEGVNDTSGYRRTNPGYHRTDVKSQQNAGPGSSQQPTRTAGSYKTININKIGRASRNRIMVKANGTTKEKLSVLVDSGADASLIKIGMLADDIPVTEETINLSGIGEGVIKALCRVVLPIRLRDRVVTHPFFVVSDDFCLDADAIMGIDFIEDHGVAIGKGAQYLYLYEQRFSILRPTQGEKIRLAPRAIGQVRVNTNSKVTGIAERKELADGVFLGNCLTTPADRKCIVNIMNVNDHEVILDTPTIDLEELYMKNNEVIEEREAYLGLMTGQTGSQRMKLLRENLRTEHLNSEERNSLFEICEEFSEIFYLPGDSLGVTDAVSHTIELIEDGRPVKVRPYRLPEMQKREISKQIDQMLENNIIRPSRSQWNAPLLVVPKKPDVSGKQKFRVVVDYRKLNEITIGDSYPLPNITEILDQLGKARYFTTLDLASGFHQIPMAERDKEKTAFSTADGHYEYNSMPFGLKNAPATFQRLMNTVLAGLQASKCYVYLDDIVIHGATLAEHNNRLVEVLKRLRESKLSLQPDKCQFLRKETSYLGHVITSEGILPDPVKIQDVRGFRSPANVKQVQSFLGLAGYYRRFIEGFSHLARPLTQLTKKGTKFEWTAVEEDAFETLKTKLTSAPILKYPDFSQPFLITTDASDKAIGAVLSQGPIGQDLPIAYASRTLNKAERNYSTTEREMLAVVFGTKQFRPYVYGTRFTVITDHLPLKWIFKVEDPGSRLLRMRIKLADYEYEVVYKPGKLNTNADALSRIYKIYSSRQELEEKHLPGEEAEAPDDRVAVNSEEEVELEYTEEDKKRILREYHDAPLGGHQGIIRTVERLRLEHNWPGLRKDVEEYISKCSKCQRNKVQKRTKAPMVVTDTPSRAFEKCALDIVGPLPKTSRGNKYILTFQDALTKFSKAMPITDQEAETVAKEFVEKIICEYGTPQVVLTDQGTNFLSDVFKNMCRLLGIEKIQTTAYHPESNGALERSHRTLAEYLKCYVNEDQTNWDEWLPYATFTYNTTPHTATGFTPYELVFGRLPEIPSSVKQAPRLTYAYEDYTQRLRETLRVANHRAKEHLEEAKERTKNYYDKKTKEVEFRVGDNVLLRDETVRRGRSAKLTPKYIGPYKIKEKNSEVNFTIKKGRKEVKVHSNRLKLFIEQ